MAYKSFNQRYPKFKWVLFLAILITLPLTVFSANKVSTNTQQHAASSPGATTKACNGNVCGRTYCDGPKNCTYHSWNCDGSTCNKYSAEGHPWSLSCATSTNSCLPPEPKLNRSDQYLGNVTCDPNAPMITVANISWQPVAGIKDYNVYYLFNIKPYKIHKIPTTDTKMTLRLNLPYGTAVSWYVFSVTNAGETSYWPSYNSEGFTALCK